MSNQSVFLIPGQKWWQSKTIIFGLVGIGTGIANATGIDLSADDQQIITDAAISLGSIVSGIGSIVGRIVARKRVGK